MSKISARIRRGNHRHARALVIAKPGLRYLVAASRVDDISA